MSEDFCPLVNESSGNGLFMHPYSLFIYLFPDLGQRIIYFKFCNIAPAPVSDPVCKRSAVISCNQARAHE